MYEVSGSNPDAPTNMEIKIIYEDKNVFVVDKPAGITVFPENGRERTFIDYLIETRPELKNAGERPRYGVAHRLDKDTSGVLLIAKNNDTLKFLQQEFETRKVVKKYIALVTGRLEEKHGIIKTLLGRSPKDPRKQKIYSVLDPKGEKNLREAVTEYSFIKSFKDYTLIEARPLTGRKHQIRVHLAHINHPIAGDKLYGFRGQKAPKGLKRQFLHGAYVKLMMSRSKIKEFISPLPKDLKDVISHLETYD